MAKKQRWLLICLLVGAVLLIGCSDQTAQLKAKDDQIVALQAQVAQWQRLSATHGVLVVALDAIQLIKDRDWATLSELVHPDKGVRFTAYPHIDPAQDLVFTAEQVAALANDQAVHHWGEYDGSGEPIDLTFGAYYDKFVYDHDFAQPHRIGNNRIIGTGNSLDNVQSAYPDGKFIEFYFEGFDPQYEGIDWSSLKLVFEQQAGVWYLVGIVHGQWTI